MLLFYYKISYSFRFLQKQNCFNYNLFYVINLFLLEISWAYNLVYETPPPPSPSLKRLTPLITHPLQK